MTEYKPIHEYLDAEHQINFFGYQVYRHGNLEEFNDLKSKFNKYIEDQLVKFSGNKLIDEKFKIEKYHLTVKNNNINHDSFIQFFGRSLDKEFLSHPFLVRLIKIAEESTGKKLRIYKDKIEFRVVRPESTDNNPLHRDHWFPYFTPLLNIYLPLCGSYCNSALGIVPFSHKWTDTEIEPTFTYKDILEGKKTTKSNGVLTSVPEVKSSTRDINIHRPDVVEGDFVLFSPLCVHGGGGNESFDTRFSFEIRLEVL